MDVIVRSNNNPVNDMTAPVSWLINDLDKVINNNNNNNNGYFLVLFLRRAHSPFIKNI